MRISQLVALALVLSGFVASIQAAVVHKWVDANGVTHYSDEPPPGNVTGIEQIELPPAHDPQKTEEAYYSIANQWRRMYRERIELERVRAERPREDRIVSRGGDTIVVRMPESRLSVAVLPRHRPGFVAPKPATPPTRRQPLAIPGRDWPVGLHPGRMRLRGGFDSR